MLVAGARDGWAYHGDNGKSYRTYQQSRKHRPGDGYQFKGTNDRQHPSGFYYSPTLAPHAYYERSTKRRFLNQWEEVITGLDHQGRDVTVGIFPYASLQIEMR